LRWGIYSVLLEEEKKGELTLGRPSWRLSLHDIVRRGNTIHNDGLQVAGKRSLSKERRKVVSENLFMQEPSTVRLEVLWGSWGRNEGEKVECSSLGEP